MAEYPMREEHPNGTALQMSTDWRHAPAVQTPDEMDAIIKVAKCHNKAKVRALLTTHIDMEVFGRRYIQKHWELYEALAFNNTVAGVIAVLQQSNTGKRPWWWEVNHNHIYKKEHRIAGFQESPHVGVKHAESMLIDIAQQARGWCYMTDDVTNFARMYEEPLYKGEMELSVFEMFFDMPRMGTGKVAEWWLNKHKPPHNPLATPLEEREGNFRAILWPKGSDFGTLPYGDHDWNNYRHCGPLCSDSDLLDPWPAGRAIFIPDGPPVDGDYYPREKFESLYHMATVSADHGMAPYFNDPNGMGAFRRARHPRKWPRGRREVQHVMPSFAFWFSLGLPPSLLVREDRMFYHFWQMRRIFQRELFKIKLRKVTEQLMPILMAPPEYDEAGRPINQGGWWYQRDAATSAGAAAYAALPVTG